MSRLWRRNQTLLCALFSFAVILLVWQMAVDYGFVKAFFVSTPIRVSLEIVRQLNTGELIENMRVSLYEFFAGLALAVLVGGALGVLASWSRTFEHALEPFICSNILRRPSPFTRCSWHGSGSASPRSSRSPFCSQ